MIHEYRHVVNPGSVKIVPCRHIWFSRELGGGTLSTEVNRMHLLLHKGGSSTSHHKRESNQNLSAGLLLYVKGEFYQLYHDRSKLHLTR